MKSFFNIQALESVVLSWGCVAFIVAITSIFWPVFVTMELMRTLLVGVTATAVTVHHQFNRSSAGLSIWIKRLIAFVCGILIMTLAVMIWLKKPFPLSPFLVSLGVAAVISSIAYFIADAVERRTLNKINKKLKENE